MSKHRNRELVEERPSRQHQEFGTRGDGYEYPDPTPVEMPTRLRLPQRQVDRVREIVRREMSRAAEAEGFESFEDADDFEIEGEEPVSPYEEVFEPEAAREFVASKELEGESGRRGVEKATPSLAKQPGKEENAPDAKEAASAKSEKQETGSAEPA